jgi:hypothetical protein
MDSHRSPSLRLSHSSGASESSGLLELRQLASSTVRPGQRPGLDLYRVDSSGLVDVSKLLDENPDLAPSGMTPLLGPGALLARFQPPPPEVPTPPPVAVHEDRMQTRFLIVSILALLTVVLLLTSEVVG